MSKKPVARCFLNISKPEGFSCLALIAEVETDSPVGSIISFNINADALQADRRLRAITYLSTFTALFRLDGMSHFLTHRACICQP